MVEQAAKRAVHGLDPYHASVKNGKPVSLVKGEPDYESFYPYLPLMTVFGLPSSTHAPIRLTDARIMFSGVTLLVVLGALVLLRAPSERKVRTLQVLTVLPTAALLLATGGDDMPIVAFLLLAVALAQRRRPGWSGIVLGVVSAMKFTAWPLAVLALFAARDTAGKRAPGKMALGLMAVAGPVVTPFLILNPHVFFVNVILYPLGLSGVASPAASPLPGHLLVSHIPGLHQLLPIVACVLGGTVLIRHLVRRPPQTPADVANLAGWVMLIAILVAPATRIGTSSTRSTSSCGRSCSGAPTRSSASTARWWTRPSPERAAPSRPPQSWSSTWSTRRVNLVTSLVPDAPKVLGATITPSCQ